jgi:protein gp37
VQRRFISAEPLLGPLDLDTAALGWVIVGGESGPRSRPMDEGWALSVVGQCRAAGVPVFVKQLGSVWAAGHGSHGKGGEMEAWPAGLRVRQFPVLDPMGQA